MILDKSNLNAQEKKPKIPRSKPVHSFKDLVEDEEIVLNRRSDFIKLDSRLSENSDRPEIVGNCNININISINAREQSRYHVTIGLDDLGVNKESLPETLKFKATGDSKEYQKRDKYDHEINS